MTYGRGDRATVLVTVGSDHHPAHRLLEAVAAWSRARPDVHVIAQRGPVAAVDGLHGDQFMPKQELTALMRAADVVVCTGGPATIAEVGITGRKPVVVPRLARHGEVVDDHQVSYARRLAADGTVVLVENLAELGRVLDRLLEDDAQLRLPGGVGVAFGDAHRRFRAVVEEAAASRDTTMPSVLIVGGSEKSGSELLERMLGGVPGVVAIGEVAHLWERGLRDDEQCACGATFGTCPFWTEVGELAFGGWERIDVREAVTDRYEVLRNRHLLALLTGVQRSTWRLRRQRLLARHRAIYRAAAIWSGASLVVDSSQHPGYAFLVRDSRVPLRCLFVAGDHRVSQLRFGPSSLVLLTLSLLRVPVHVARGKALREDPEGELGQVMRFLGMPDATSVAMAQAPAERGTVTHVLGSQPKVPTARSTPPV